MGWAVASDGNYIYGGAISDDTKAVNAGAVYVFDRQGQLLQTYLPPTTTANTSFGGSLASDNPLMVDQPEDNLDNKFIFHTVVDSLRKVKTSRQITLITHNPNIPVLGDAEGVFVLTSDGQQARLLNSGGVDDCRTHIVDLLEGGEEAFVQRKKRYHY